MNAILDFIAKVMEQAGTKLPLIWPDIVEISKRMQHITTVLRGATFGASQGPPATAQAGKLVELAVKHGVPHDEANSVLGTLEQSPAQIS